MLTITRLIAYPKPAPKKFDRAKWLRDRRRKAAASNKCSNCTVRPPVDGLKTCVVCKEHGKRKKK